MNKSILKGLAKHGDFIVLDLLCLQFCYVLSYWINVDFAIPYFVSGYRYQAFVLFVAQIVVILFSNNYHGILRRGWFDETTATLTYIASVFVIALVYLFLVHWVGMASRLQMGVTSVLFWIVGLLIRQMNKRRIRAYVKSSGKKHSLVVVTSRGMARTAMKQLTNTVAYQGYFISHLVLMDEGPSNPVSIDGVPVLSMDAEGIKAITHEWVDEVFILQPDRMPFPAEFVDNLTEMGLTVSYAMAGANLSVTEAGKVGPYTVLTSRIREVSTGPLMVKRLIDIIGGFIGCVCTALIFIVIAPIIYHKSPGPIFFVQERVGQNGKKFKMYKFRSMYMDAEERKAALMAQNRVDTGLMFKLDNDPRVIGNDQGGRHSKPHGIGYFIRRYSIDEFPQFFNVLKGDMSLVGTRPPTVDEWERYDMAHRVRMSIKPGITGLWQVSGRSKITDFEQVVRLDREYIESWNLGLDFKILCKTVIVVIGGRGAL